MSKLNPLYEHGDVKYFYNLHIQRQRQMGMQPISYPGFRLRLERGMTIKEAIYTPTKKPMSRYNMKPKETWKDKLTTIRFRFISFFKR